MESKVNGGKKGAKRSGSKSTQAEDGSQDLFKEDKQDPSLYDLLQVFKDATTTDIKKSYRMLALKLHPDKNTEDPDATRAFQRLNEAYQILINPEKRRLYDETGYTGEDDSAGFAEAYSYYRGMYKKVEKQDIEDFEKEYKLSKAEEEDIVNYYLDHKGDLTHMLEAIILSRNEDLPRFVQLLEDKIANNEVRKFKSFDKTKKNIKLLPDEEEELKQDEAESLKDLTSAIMLRQKARGTGLLDELEQRFAKKGVKGQRKAKKKAEYDIDDDEFDRLQAQMFSKKGKKVKK